MSKLSVIVPSIRIENLGELWWSIHYDLGFDFEFIVISPYDRPKDSIVANYWIKSQRSPNACQQQGLTIATGEYISFASDDGVFLPGALDYALSMAEERTIVVGKYLEGENYNVDMLTEDYYRFKYHKDYRLKGVPQEALIFNCGIISRKLILELGGWDTEHFDTTTCAHADLGIRAYKAGAEMVLMDKPMFSCTHEPKRTGTHGPIHDSMNKHDIPAFKKMYSKPIHRQNINIDNWKNTEVKWSRRFHS